ncbi:hypothetical protein CSIM01_06211 [Colletotrichum simmondsii]|uniref:Uncharacterized protein n=1 Tax=Colletotrichum simmondsii TaxID=703756 RepID=A0A135SNE1_9PEZI|nr:hypothetical protein CSIM01_06211 [Colletotrichum simmondsii]
MSNAASSCRVLSLIGGPGSSLAPYGVREWSVHPLWDGLQALERGDWSWDLPRKPHPVAPNSAFRHTPVLRHRTNASAVPLPGAPFSLLLSLSVSLSLFESLQLFDYLWEEALQMLPRLHEIPFMGLFINKGQPNHRRAYWTRAANYLRPSIIIHHCTAHAAPARSIHPWPLEPRLACNSTESTCVPNPTPGCDGLDLCSVSSILAWDDRLLGLCRNFATKIKQPKRFWWLDDISLAGNFHPTIQSLCPLWSMDPKYPNGAGLHCTHLPDGDFPFLGLERTGSPSKVESCHCSSWDIVAARSLSLTPPLPVLNFSLSPPLESPLPTPID